MSRQKFEFMCTECKKFFDFLLNTALEGNYRIHCPNCNHVHYRKVKKGEITDVRFSENQNDVYIVEDIRPMKASCRDFQKEKAEDPERGFMNRLWHEFFSARVDA